MASGRDAKPVEYSHSCTVRKPIEYSVVEGAYKGNQSGTGTLHVGRVVWLDHDLEKTGEKAKVRAFVDGIGLIRIDPADLSAIC